MNAGLKAAAAVTVVLAVAAGAFFGLRAYQRRKMQSSAIGAVIRESPDTTKESPITGVEVTAIGPDGAQLGTTQSNFFGYFSLPMPRGIVAGETVLLQYRHPDYQPLDQKDVIGESLAVARMIPLHGEVEAELDPTAALVSNVIIRYTTETDATTSVGTDGTTFQVTNTGNVPCHTNRPCSPDGKWKAAVASASLDAGEGNVFRNARASCIAGPCPFTRIDTDNFSRGGRKISITVRDWSDTTTYLLQAEVMRSQLSSIIRTSYALIFGRSMNFSVPAAAEGTSIEAELNGVETIFPLGPDPQLSWAECHVEIQSNQARDFRCELKPGYRFQ